MIHHAKSFLVSNSRRPFGLLFCLFAITQKPNNYSGATSRGGIIVKRHCCHLSPCVYGAPSDSIAAFKPGFVCTAWPRLRTSTSSREEARCENTSTPAKHSKGIMYANPIEPAKSLTAPISGVTMAPPTTQLTMSPDPISVSSPSPAYCSRSNRTQSDTSKMARSHGGTVKPV